MELSPLLTVPLTVLTESLNDPNVDLLVMLSDLTGQLTAIVPTFLGLTITVHSGGFRLP
jgi:hypothetical protein